MIWFLSLLLLFYGIKSFDDDITYESTPYKTISGSEHQKIKNQLDLFQKNWIKTKTASSNNYEYIFEWNCFCSTCLELSKFISVLDNKINKIAFSDKLKYDYYDYDNNDNINIKSLKEFDLKLPAYGCDDLYLHSKHYHSIDDLFQILQQSLHPNYYDPNRHIISMTFDKKL